MTSNSGLYEPTTEHDLDDMGDCRNRGCTVRGAKCNGSRRLSWAEVYERFPKCEHRKTERHTVIGNLNTGTVAATRRVCPGSPALQEAGE